VLSENREICLFLVSQSAFSLPFRERAPERPEKSKGQSAETLILDIFNCAGTLCAFGFLGSCGLISVSAPAYLARMGIVRSRDFWIAAASLGLLLFPAVGSVYPVPSWPVNTYPYIFAVYLALGMLWVVVLHRVTPGLADGVRRRVYLDHGQGVAADVDIPPVQRPGGFVR
jgi:hypothetical protein